MLFVKVPYIPTGLQRQSNVMRELSIIMQKQKLIRYRLSCTISSKILDETNNFEENMKKKIYLFSDSKNGGGTIRSLQIFIPSANR